MSSDRSCEPHSPLLFVAAFIYTPALRGPATLVIPSFLVPDSRRSSLTEMGRRTKPLAVGVASVRVGRRLISEVLFRMLRSEAFRLVSQPEQNHEGFI